ncbi:hypothetical protein TIFTF001_017591 [Ficus carica]|uniref:Uncharacterized protein n=1 Tax=Ficus carica TaxID=3494 RepID=A0AA88AQZ2_FICCA|nr:hypothetical protein TIFTF001_017591 [Ficus carica]
MGKRVGDLVIQFLVLWFLVVLIFMVGNTHCSRQTDQYFKVKPCKSQNSANNFLGFLPKGSPIPPSGPSREHNGIGLQSYSEQLP